MLSLLIPLFLVFAAGTPKYGLPPGATILEERSLAKQSYPNRTLVLWMENATQHPGSDSDEFGSCPELTRGSYYSGQPRLSLVDHSGAIINTVKIPPYEGENEVDIPYRIVRGPYYKSDAASRTRAGRAIIMALRDYTGEGKALQFALFDAVACMGLGTTLLGYEPRTDRAINYPVVIKTIDGKPQKMYWVDYLFSEKPRRPGYWKYGIDYQGRGGAYVYYEIRFDRMTSTFRGTLRETCNESCQEMNKKP